MHTIDLRKIYRFHPVDPAPSPSQLPTAGDIYYECLECGVIASSVPRIKTRCTCGNLSGEDGALTVNNSAKVRVVQGKLK